MNRAELETTARIKRDTLRGLLDEMTDQMPRGRQKRLARGSSQDMTRAELKAAQTVADARAKLDAVEERTSSHELKLAVPAVPSWEAPPPIEMAKDDCIVIHSLPPHAEVVTVEEPVPTPHVLALIAMFGGAFLVGLTAVYVLA